jgi:acid phosphatase (class A)
MSRLLRSIQDILYQQKLEKLQNLTYKNLLQYNKPKPEPFDYFVLENPPANDSIQTRTELENIVKLTESRTEQQLQEILLIDKDPIFLYIDFLKQFNLEYPLEQLDRLYIYLYKMITELKLFYNRPRPNQIAEYYGIDIDIIKTKSHETPAYPSGHTAYAKLAELIAIEYFPQYKNTFLKFTKKVADSRVLQGVHFPSDNIASITFVNTIYTKLKEINDEL